MLQEATKVLSSAFGNSFIRKLSLYLHDCVREEVKSSTFRNLKQEKDNKWDFLQEEKTILSNESGMLEIEGTNSKITEMLLQSETAKKDRYLIYGYMFLEGKTSNAKNATEFLTPLLYIPCKLERKGKHIICSLTDDTLSLNTGALASIIKSDDEDEIEHLFEGLIDAVPELPLTEDKLQIFLTTLKSIVPGLNIENITIDNNQENPEEQDEKEKNKEKNTSEEALAEETEVNSEIDDDSEQKLSETLYRSYLQSTEPTEEKRFIHAPLKLTDSSAVILTKRPSPTAGVLHELTQMSEKPAGMFRETSLNTIQEEFVNSKKLKDKAHIEFDNNEKELKNFFPIVPLQLSDCQEDVLKAIQTNDLVSVFGPPGTGKTQTIVNLIFHLIANDKKVLVVSRMDKAVDVIGERLNRFGAPFLCLRAGKGDYQKKLYFQLQDLLSNKVDLDTGFENSLLTEIQDLEDIKNKIDNLKINCEEIINSEEEWFDINEKYQNFLEQNNQEEIIQQDLTLEEIQKNKQLLEKIHSLSDKTTFLDSLNKNIKFKILMNKLKLKNLKPTEGNLARLDNDLVKQELYNNLRKKEVFINKKGNLQESLKEVNDLKKQERLLAISVLKNKRREVLKSLIRDQFKRQRLMIHCKTLMERKKNLQNRLLHEEDFEPLLEAFPCWAVTTYALSESLPLKPGIFDVVIIDEASQCDIASCFPAMFRAKKAVIVGDDKQLAHMSFLEKAKEQSFLSQYDIPDRYQLMWRFRTNSVFDLANFYSSSQILLDEHYRSPKEIIGFSNKEFYGNRIRVMKKNLPFKDKNVELNIIKEAKVDLDSTRNMAEVESIMKKLLELIEQNKQNNIKQTIGIISPFRGQVELIKKAVNQVLTGDVIKRHKIEIGTAHTFQGDEKDIILLSFTLAENSHHQSLTFAQKPNLFNVAITRARENLICFVSRESNSLFRGLLRNYLEYIKSIEQQEAIPEEDYSYNNHIEKEIADLCQEEGLIVIPNFETAGLNADMLIHNNKNAIIIEFDGINDNSIKQTNNIYPNVHKQDLMERCGWKVIRITAREWHYSKNICIKRIKENLVSA